MTTIFMVYPRLSTIQSCGPGEKSSVASHPNVNIEAVGLVQLKSATLGVFAVRAAGMYRVRFRVVRNFLIFAMTSEAA
jgi:hypothetical protein